MKYVTSIFNTALLVRQFGNRFSTNQRMFSSLTNNEINPIQNIYNQLDLIPDISYSVNNPVLCPHLKSVLDTMKTVTLTDLGLTETQVLAMTRNTCSTIIEVTDRFEIAVFHMSAGCTLPIHDHPYMAVLSNVVYGEIKLQSFSPNPIDMPTGKGFASDSRQSSTKSQSIIARCCNEGTKTPQDGAWLLSPQGE